MNEHLAPTHSSEDMPKPIRPRTARRIALFARSFLAGVLALSLSFVAHAGWGKADPDFSNYDVPLYEQIRNHISAKVLTRLGEGKNTRERYFIIPFAYENKGNDPEFSHSFMSVIRVFADGKEARVTAGLKKQTFKNRNFEAFTISWLPHDFATNPNLCVFEGVGARISPSRNTCPMSVGKSFNLEETIRLAVNVRNAVCMWGPYEIRKEGFDVVVKRLRLLEGGTIKYRADDRLTRKAMTAINCFHAMAGLTKLYPDGGIFGTGFKIWGLNGTERVLREYKEAAAIKGLLLEPIDGKRDRYGFVYAPTRNGRVAYNPFQTASAYRR
jgi:hypothetical protein